MQFIWVNVVFPQIEANGSRESPLAFKLRNYRQSFELLSFEILETCAAHRVFEIGS